MIKGFLHSPWQSLGIAYIPSEYWLDEGRVGVETSTVYMQQHGNEELGGRCCSIQHAQAGVEFQ
jgi:hypothetical protein